VSISRSFRLLRAVEDVEPPASGGPFLERKGAGGRIETSVVAAADIEALVTGAATAARAAPRVATVRSFDFENVYLEHVGFVWRVLRGMGVSDALVEDAVQDAFIVVHRRLGEFDGLGSLKTWLFQIAYRVACTYRRQHRRAAEHQPLDDRLRSGTPTPAEEVERRETATLLTDLLDGLDDEKRAVLVLADIEELTAPEIAMVTGTPLNTVYTRLRRARSQLNQALRARRWRGR
jgi:RNA polymerase sigma-70 factor, ECF subfamily